MCTSFLQTCTLAYRVLRRGVISITPQLRLSTGEVMELADFKISIKHPVRNVMELCLGLSTQSAVLPVLLTLIMHSKRDSELDERFFFEVIAFVYTCILFYNCIKTVTMNAV